MPIEITEFHFLRPHLLWLLIPVIGLIYYLTHSQRKQSAWQNVISPHLLEFLFVSGKKNKVRSPAWLTGLLAASIILAISGPSFRQKAVPVFRNRKCPNYFTRPFFVYGCNRYQTIAFRKSKI